MVNIVYGKHSVSFSIKNIFYDDKMDLRLFYIPVTTCNYLLVYF